MAGGQRLERCETAKPPSRPWWSRVGLNALLSRKGCSAFKLLDQNGAS